MKQDQQRGKVFRTILLILSLSSTIVFSQNHFADRKPNKADNLESRTLSKFMFDPITENNFKNFTNPNLPGLFKLNGTETAIDSFVVLAYDTSYQWVKYSYDYDDYGYLKEYLAEYTDEGVKGYLGDYHFEYRPDGQLLSRLNLNWKNGVWVNDYRGSYTYDPNGNIISELYEQWDITTNNWVNDYKYEYSYDANHNGTLEVYARWDGSSWKNIWKYEWIYDANNNKISKIGYSWTGSAWKNYSKTTNTYDANNINISRNTFSWNSSTSQWDNIYWYLYTYDSNNKITFEYKKKWDSGTSNWVDDYRTTYTNSASGKMLTYLRERWDGSNWNNEYHQEFTYDVNDNLLTLLRQYNWNGSSWTDGDRWTYTYNTVGNCDGGMYETWFINHWVSDDAFIYIPELPRADSSYLQIFSPCINGYKFNLYYRTITDVNENNNIKPNSFSLSQNYPNPFNPSTTIKYSIPSVAKQNFASVKLKVYDVLGEEVATLINKEQAPGSYEVNFDASKLTSGIYFYQLKAGNNIQVKKMILLK